MTHRKLRAPAAWLVLAWALATLGGCAGARPGYETPTVTLRSIQPVSSAQGLPRFAITLGVVNPNRETLDIVGVAYTVRIAGQDVVKGVGKGFEPIEGYETGELKLMAEANLLAGIRLLGQLASDDREALDWELRAKLDLGPLRRAIRVTETGTFSSLTGTPPR